MSVPSDQPRPFGGLPVAAGLPQGQKAPGDAAPTAPPIAHDASVPTDEENFEAFRRGDRAGFTRLVERYQRELYHFLWRFLGDRAAAEDAFQETFLQIWQSAAQFDLQRRFKPWLFTIAANKARDMLRSQSRHPPAPLQANINPGSEESGEFVDLMSAVAEQPGAQLERQELQRLVYQTVMRLPVHLREILLLSYFHQFPYRNIAEILQIPLGTVKSRLHAAVALFADRWRKIQSNNPPGTAV
jgi:RNA polymerase sigma-70 factor (ECF subfamily)